MEHPHHGFPAIMNCTFKLGQSELFSYVALARVFGHNSKKRDYYKSCLCSPTLRCILCLTLLKPRKEVGQWTEVDS